MKNLTQTLFAALLFFAACENKPATTTATVAEVPATPVSTTKCYEQRFKTDLTAIELTLVGKEASGFYAYEPTEKDGGHGSFKGTVAADGQIQAIFTYMIEGSIQSEEMVFKMAGDKLLKGAGELVDLKNDGNLTIKDKTKLNFKESFSPVDCATVDKAIANAKQTTNLIKGSAMAVPVLTKKDSAAAALLVGDWQSKDDPKASIKIADGKFWFLQKGDKTEIPMKYQYYPSCPKDCNPVADVPCLKIMGQDDVCYTIVKADGKSLELSQIGGMGNTNKYVRKK
jgi:hypothetical protein